MLQPFKIPWLQITTIVNFMTQLLKNSMILKYITNSIGSFVIVAHQSVSVIYMILSPIKQQSSSV